MAIPPRKIRDLPAALPAKDSDIFPISQLNEDGQPTTRAMTRAQNNAEMIDVISGARQEFVDMAEAEHDRLDAKIDGIVLTPGPKGDKGNTGDAGLPKRISRFTATTNSVGVATVAFSPAFTAVPDVDIIDAWNGEQLVSGAVVPGTLTVSGCQVQVMVSRGTLLLTTGPFAKAGTGVSITVRAIGN